MIASLVGVRQACFCLDLAVVVVVVVVVVVTVAAAVSDTAVTRSPPPSCGLGDCNLRCCFSSRVSLLACVLAC